MPLSSAQTEITSATERFRVAVCGRRFGKTHVSLRELSRFARLPNRKVWYIAPTRAQAKTIAWSKLKRKLQRLNWVRNINESELTIFLKNGSEISLKSAEVGDRLRGSGIDFVVLDEFADMDPSVWYEIIRPALSDTQGHALFIGTPKGSANWAKDIYDGYLTKKGWRSFSFTTLDGGNVPVDEVEQARIDLAPKVFRQEYMATWESFSGVIFNEFGDHNIAAAQPVDEHEPLIAGIDFNVTPICCVIMRRLKDGLHAIDEIVIENSNTTELVNEIRSRYPENPITAFPDPAGVQRRTSANGLTDIKILENAGFTVRYHRSHPLVKDRINAGNSLFFKREDGSTRFKVDPRCRDTIKSFKNWAYKEGTMQPDKDSGFDHICDSATYAIEFLFPIRRQLPPELTAPARWGHAI